MTTYNWDLIERQGRVKSSGLQAEHRSSLSSPPSWCFCRSGTPALLIAARRSELGLGICRKRMRALLPGQRLPLHSIRQVCRHTFLPSAHNNCKRIVVERSEPQGMAFLRCNRDRDGKSVNIHRQDYCPVSSCKVGDRADVSGCDCRPFKPTHTARCAAVPSPQLKIAAGFNECEKCAGGGRACRKSGARDLLHTDDEGI